MVGSRNSICQEGKVKYQSASRRFLDWSCCRLLYSGLLAGPVDNMAGIVRAYRRHAGTVQELDACIAGTDSLIDQIVYRLYGLSEEEIAIVEGEMAN